MSTAKELFDLMQHKLAALIADKEDYLARHEEKIQEVNKIKVAIAAVCRHEDGEEYVFNHDYHNDVDKSYYRCRICGHVMREA